MTTLYVIVGLLLIGFVLVKEGESLLESHLQRGGKSIYWIWSSMLGHSPDTQRRRRFLPDDNTDAWWKEMQTNNAPLAALSPSEDIYFSGLRHTETFGNFKQELPKPETLTTTTTEHTPQPYDIIDSTLLRELIIEEHHRPSKIEIQSALQRLRESMNESSTALSEVTTEPTTVDPPLQFQNLRESEESLSSVAESEKPMSAVEYVIPGVEHILPQVEYLNPLEALRESEEPFFVRPRVEYVKPEIEYTKTENVSEITTYSLEDESEMEIEEEIGKKDPVLTMERYNVTGQSEEEDIVDRLRILRLHMKTTKEENRRSRRVHKRDPELGIPDIDYPRLEILPVVHFPCEDYDSPGYYADTISQCQMFHICHEDGQRTSFLCPVGTVFNQEYLVCDWWYNVDCENFLSYSRPASNGAFSMKDRNLEYINLVTRKNGNENKPNEYEAEKYSDYLVNRADSVMNGKTTQKGEQYQPQRTTNYPMGYAILLRETMKSSPKQPGVENITESPNLKHLGGNLDDKMNIDDGVKNSEEVTYHESKKLRNVKQSKQFNKQETHYRYFGGSKPFAVKSEKWLHKKVKSKRIRVKYLSPENVSTIKPEVNDPISFSWNVRNPVDSSAYSLVGNKKVSSVNDKGLRWTSINSSRSSTPFVPELYLGSNQRESSFQRSINQDYEVVYPLHHRRSDKSNLNTQNNDYLSAESVIQYENDDITKSTSFSEPNRHAFYINGEIKTQERKVKERNEEKINESIYANIPPTEYKRKRTQTHEVPLEKKQAATPDKKYILNPDDDFVDAGRRKKYGDRLCKRPCQSKETDIIFKSENKKQIFQLMNDTRDTQSKQDKTPINETTQNFPVYFNPEISHLPFKPWERPQEIRVSMADERAQNSKASKSVYSKGMQSITVPPETITYPHPVYIPPEKPKRQKGPLKTLEINSINETELASSENDAYASEFLSTNSFIERISNLLSEIKAEDKNTTNSEQQKKNQGETSFTVNVQNSAKDSLNRTLSRKALRHSTSYFKPWNIDDHYSPIPPRTYNETYKNKLGHGIEILNIGRTKNQTRNRNAYSGYVVIKKVRLK